MLIENKSNKKNWLRDYIGTKHQVKVHGMHDVDNIKTIVFILTQYVIQNTVDPSVLNLALN